MSSKILTAVIISARTVVIYHAQNSWCALENRFEWYVKWHSFDDRSLLKSKECNWRKFSLKKGTEKYFSHANKQKEVCKCKNTRPVNAVHRAVKDAI